MFTNQCRKLSPLLVKGSKYVKHTCVKQRKRDTLAMCHMSMSSSSSPAPVQAIVSNLADDPVSGIAQLNLERMETPDLTKYPEDSVVVAVSHCAVHWVDCLMMAGQYQQAPPLPYTPGMEYSGTVVSSSGNSGVSPGDRVCVADMINAGPRSYGAYQKNGGFATYSVAPAIAIRKVSEKLSMAEVATLHGAYETAYHALVHCARVKRGETALIHGATGATGLAAVQLCSALGVNTVISGGSDEKLDVVAKQCLGEGRVIGRHNYRNESASLVKDVKNATKSVEVVYDTVGGLDLARNSLKVLKFGGRYCIVGWTSTPFAGGGRGAGANHGTSNTIPTNLIMMKGAQILGCPVAIHTNLDPSIRIPRMEMIDRMVSEGLIKPHVSHEFPLLDVKEALLAKWNRKVIGGCVVKCN